MERFSIRLTPPEAEAAFRRDALDADRRLANALVLLAVAFQAVSMPMDAVLVQDRTRLLWIWGVRLSSALLGLGVVYLIRARSVRAFELTLFTWLVLTLGGLVAANALLPADYTLHVAWDILLTLAAYTVAPLPLPLQAAAAAVMTVGDVALFMTVKELPRAGGLSDILLAFSCAHVVGAFTSWAMQRARRSQFAALGREKAALADLQHAMDEIRTLRGIIPICASCKQVRTDAGDWEQVEAYVREHSQADFSHGLCPTCAQTIYGEFADEPGPARG